MIDELIKSSGILIGKRQVAKAIAEQEALRCVILADDADKAFRDSVTSLCAAASIEILAYPSKAELGKKCKIAVDCAVIGVKM